MMQVEDTKVARDNRVQINVTVNSSNDIILQIEGIRNGILTFSDPA
jgi:hypothetical protein